MARLRRKRGARYILWAVMVVGVAAGAILVVVGAMQNWTVFPGVPAPGSPTAEQFDLAYWSAVYAGVIAGILTGVITGFSVGLAIWWIQKRTELREVRRGYERDVNVLQESIRAVRAGPDTLVNTSAANSVPRSARVIYQLLQTHPIDVWQSELPQPQSFLDSLVDFRRAYRAFLLAADRLDVHLAQFVRTYHAELSLDMIHDEEAIWFCTGRLQGVPGGTMFDYIPSPLCSLADLETMYERVLEDTKAAEYAQQIAQEPAR